MKHIYFLYFGLKYEENKILVVFDFYLDLMIKNSSKKVISSNLKDGQIYKHVQTLVIKSLQ